MRSENTELGESHCGFGDPVVDERPTLNPQYPSSWWAIGFSHEISAGMVVPVKLLERDLMLWRDASGRLHCHSAICPHLGANIGYGGSVVDGTVRCPFHGYRYDGAGRVCERVGEDSRAPRRLALQAYTVEEHFGTIFVWNGRGEPDHGFPHAPIRGGTGSADEADLSCFHVAFYLPFPAKPFAENVADANHFGALHRSCDWGETVLIEESPWFLKQRLELRNPTRAFSASYLREMLKIGQLLNPSVATNSGMTMTTFGGGIHLVEVDSFRPAGGKAGMFGKVLDVAAAARAVVCWTPITAQSHWHGITFIMPKLALPLPQGVVRRLMERVLASRDWGAALQDGAVMYYRQEPVNPAYGRLDRGLVRFRRFWDSRIEDRSLREGDGIHSNGLRAGIRWENDAGGQADTLATSSRVAP